MAYTGEVFVLDDGGEVDLDLGNYERFLDITLHKDNNITTGKIYQGCVHVCIIGCVCVIRLYAQGYV